MEVVNSLSNSQTWFWNRCKFWTETLYKDNPGKGCIIDLRSKIQGQLQLSCLCEVVFRDIVTAFLGELWLLYGYNLFLLWGHTRNLTDSIDFS